MDAGWIRKAARTTLRPARYHWWHAAALGLAANLVSGAAGRREEDRRYYEDMEQASFAPPGWVFGPVWAANNVSVLWGNLRLLNLPQDAPNRQTLLVVQGLSWILFSTFGYVYFRKGSPILAFGWTATFWILTIASMVLSLRSDRKVAASLATLLAWLTLATPVAAYQAAKNPDPLLGYDPRGS